jgi:hypothetical protein
MILDCVLTAVNDNPLYLDFVPYFIKCWNKLYPSVEVVIILLSDCIPGKLLNYSKNIILFKPIDNISTAFISQYIRILYPALLNKYKNGILITDMDIVPMNGTYYTEYIKSIDDDKFVYYRDHVCYPNEIAICYNVAVSKIWSDIFNIYSVDDINDRLINVYKTIHYAGCHGGPGWSTDQVDLCKYVMEWNKKTNNFVRLNEGNTKFYRLDRDFLNLDDTNLYNYIKEGIYSDYHCLRPYEKYKEANEKIYESL